MSLHTWGHQSPRKPSSYDTFTHNRHWGRAATGKKSLGIYAHGVTSVVSDSLQPVDSGPPGFSVREAGSPGKNTGAYGPILVTIPF